jgi:hypothetical protein
MQRRTSQLVGTPCLNLIKSEHGYGNRNRKTGRVTTVDKNAISKAQELRLEARGDAGRTKVTTYWYPNVTIVSSTVFVRLTTTPERITPGDTECGVIKKEQPIGWLGVQTLCEASRTRYCLFGQNRRASMGTSKGLQERITLKSVCPKIQGYRAIHDAEGKDCVSIEATDRVRSELPEFLAGAPRQAACVTTDICATIKKTRRTYGLRSGRAGFDDFGQSLTRQPATGPDGIPTGLQSRKHCQSPSTRNSKGWCREKSCLLNKPSSLFPKWSLGRLDSWRPPLHAQHSDRLIDFAVYRTLVKTSGHLHQAQAVLWQLQEAHKEII